MNLRCADFSDDQELVYHNTAWQLRSSTQFASAKPLFIDFQNKQLTYRIRHASLKNELVARAVGCKKGFRPRVLDTTAGLGRDAFVLASFGCSVLMLERSPQLALLLLDALVRRYQGSAPPQLQCLCMDARMYLKQLPAGQQPDVIFLDPMFPEPPEQRRALPGHEWQMLRELVGDDADATALFELALQQAKRRVVVKRPRHAPALGSHSVDVTYQSGGYRFDVYLNANNDEIKKQ